MQLSSLTRCSLAGTGEVRVNMSELLSEEQADSHGHSHEEPAPLQRQEVVSMLMPYLFEFGAFVLILLLKILYSHRYGRCDYYLILDTYC